MTINTEQTYQIVDQYIVIEDYTHAECTLFKRPYGVYRGVDHMLCHNVVLTNFNDLKLYSFWLLCI